MKIYNLKINLLVMSILICFSLAQGQNYKSIFLADDIDSYVGTYFKLANNKKLEHALYDYQPTKMFQEPVYKPTSSDRAYSDTLFVTGREFLVVKVSRTKNFILSSDNCIFELIDTLTDQKLYYVYAPKYESDFPFLVKGFEYTIDYLLDDITKVVDEFTDETIYRTPLNSQIVLQKIIDSLNTESFFLSLTSFGSAINLDIKGVTILFKDGSKWNRPEENIDVNVSGSRFKYSVFIKLTNEDLDLFSRKKIDKWRLYVYDSDLSDIKTEKIPFYTQALIQLKKQGLKK